MKFIAVIFKWIWRGLQILGPIAPVLWGVAIYGGLAASIMLLIDNTKGLIVILYDTFTSWAGSIDELVAQMFSAVSDNSFFMFGYYVFSLDVPFGWLHSAVKNFVQYWLTGICGIMIGGLEIAIVVVCIFFIRKRVKVVMSFGMGGES